MKIPSPFQRFAQSGALAGILLFFAAVVAFILANSPWHESYFSLKEIKFGLEFGDWQLKKPLELWVNDFLMTIFFLLVGLEIKRELIIGELSNIRQASLAIFAAIGGMIVPALIYFAVNSGETAKGFGIPMATDIAFALGVLSLFGNRIPFSLKILLTAIAIVDDLGAILVIAIFYTTKLNLLAFLIAIGFWMICWILNFFRVRNLIIYAIVGILIWYFIFLSGLHATIAGVLLAFTIPLARRIDIPKLELNAGDSEEIGSQLENLERRIEEAQSPLHRLEHGLQPWVTYLILPVFAFFNGGIFLAQTSIDLVTVGVFFGLIIGKPIGIVSASWLAIRLRLARLPSNRLKHGDHVSWRQIWGLGAIAGIGFTMSLFIAGLAFDGGSLNAAKLGILFSSLIAPVIGFVFLRKK